MFYQESEINNLKKCSVCQQTFFDPRMLPCDHTFCNECIYTLQKPDEKMLTCIQCNTDHSLSFDFPVNLLASELIMKYPNEVIRSKSVSELKKSLNLLTENTEMLQSNLDNGNLAINEHCSKLRRDIQLNTELHI